MSSPCHHHAIVINVISITMAWWYWHVVDDDEMILRYYAYHHNRVVSKLAHIFAWHVLRGASRQWSILKSSCILVVARRLATVVYFKTFLHSKCEKRVARRLATVVYFKKLNFKTCYEAPRNTACPKGLTFSWGAKSSCETTPIWWYA